MDTKNKILVKVFFYSAVILLLLLFSDDIANIFWKDDQLNDISTFGTLLASIVAIGAIFGVYIQLVRAEKQNKRQRTYDLVSKYYTPGYHEYIFEAAYFVTNTLNYPKTEQFLNKHHPNYKETRKTCLVLFNYLEEVCLMYNMNLLDKDLFERTLGGTTILLYYYSKEIIKNARTKADDKRLFIEWQNCAKVLNSKFKLIDPYDFSMGDAND